MSIDCTMSTRHRSFPAIVVLSSHRQRRLVPEFVRKTPAGILAEREDPVHEVERRGCTGGSLCFDKHGRDFPVLEMWRCARKHMESSAVEARPGRLRSAEAFGGRRGVSQAYFLDIGMMGNGEWTVDGGRI